MRYAQPRGNLPEAGNDRGPRGSDPIDKEWVPGQTEYPTLCPDSKFQAIHPSSQKA